MFVLSNCLSKGTFFLYFHMFCESSNDIKFQNIVSEFKRYEHTYLTLGKYAVSTYTSLVKVG